MADPPSPTLEVTATDASIRFAPGDVNDVGPQVSYADGQPLYSVPVADDGLAYLAVEVSHYASYTVSVSGMLTKLSVPSRTLPLSFQIARRGLFKAGAGYQPVPTPAWGAWTPASAGLLESGRVGPGVNEWWFRGQLVRNGKADHAGTYGATINVTFFDVTMAP